MSSIAQYAANVGWIGDDLLTAIAVAYAESSGNEAAYFPETDYFTRKEIPPEQTQGKGSCGLWQIFLYMHPEFTGWNLKDGQVNACAARLIWQRAGNSFNPWSTYSGAGSVFKKHLAQAQQDVAALSV